MTATGSYVLFLSVSVLQNMK